MAWSRLLRLPLLFAALSVVPAAASLAGQFPDWSFMYLVDPQRLPRLWIVGAGLVAGAAVALGFALGVKGFRRYGTRPLGIALAVGLCGYLGLCALGWRSGRLALVGRFADFHAGGWLMQPVLQLPGAIPGPYARPAGLFYALVATNLCVGIALFLVARVLLTKGEFIFAAVPPATLVTDPATTLATTTTTTLATVPVPVSKTAGPPDGANDKSSNHWQS